MMIIIVVNCESSLNLNWTEVRKEWIIIDVISSETATTLILIRRMHPKSRNEWDNILTSSEIFTSPSFWLVKCFKNYIDPIWHTFVYVNLMAFNQQTAKCSMLNDIHHSYAHANGNDSTLKALNWTMKPLHNIIFPYFFTFSI